MSVLTMDSRSTRTKWRDVLDTVATGASDIVVTRNSKETVAIIPFEDYEAIAETLQELRETRLADALIDQWHQGKISAHPWAAIKANLLAERGLDEPIRDSDARTSGEGVSEAS